MEDKYLLDTHVIMQAFNSGLELPEAFYTIAAISKDEILSFHDINEIERSLIDSILEKIDVLEANEEIIENAKLIQSKYNIAVADAVISATAYTYNLTLITNDSTFKELKEINREPFYFVQ